MASPRHPTTMENLPHEVLSDIFVRLWAKQLALMRCVCKPWNALLSESSFVKSHLHHSIHHNDEILLLFHWGLSSDPNPFAASLLRSPYLELTNFTKFPVIPKHKNGYGKIIGSANGLICFSFGRFQDLDIYIWNPFLSAVLTLPPSTFPSRHLLVGFGFDPKSDDYKVFKQYEVYSMRKGSWDLVSQKCPLDIRILKGQNIACADGLVGHLHWLGWLVSTIGFIGFESREDKEKILAFDLGAETFSEIPFPDSILHHHIYRHNVLGVLAGKLCVMSRLQDGKCEVWVMDEYGVAESWVKHHAFSQFTNIFPIGFTSHSEFLFRVGKDDRFGLYDPVAAKTKTFKLMDTAGITKVVDYVDSLVWVAPAERDRICCRS